MSEQVGTNIERDPMLDKMMPGLNNAASVRAEHQSTPTYRFGQLGTTIYKPKRNDPEVEAVLGEHKYNPRKSPDSPEELRRKTACMENELSTVKAQMAALLAALSNDPAPEPDAPGEAEPEMPENAPRRRSARRSTR